jgi:hypothetical protein
MVPVQYQFEGRARMMPERFVLTRDDTGAALSVVSGRLPGGTASRGVGVLSRSGGAAALHAGNCWSARWGPQSLGTSQDRHGGQRCRKRCRPTWCVCAARNVLRQIIGNHSVVHKHSCGLPEHFRDLPLNDMTANRRKHIKVEHSKKFDHQSVKESLGLIDEAWANFLTRVNPMAALNERCAGAEFFESLFVPMTR